MLKATIIWTKNEHGYFNTYGELFYLDELYELELPFYACYVPGNNNIIAAFQEKYDLIHWMTTPLFRNHTKELKERDDS